MDKLIAFLIGTLKIAVALFLVVIALIGVYIGWNSVQDSRQKATNAPLAEAKAWPPIIIDALENTRFSLVTMWRDGHLYYQFTVSGYPKAIELVRRHSQKVSLGDQILVISFLDRNGFNVYSHEVKLSSMTLEVDSKGQGKGLNLNSNTYMTAEDYRGALKWEVGWNFPTSVELPPSAPVQAAPAAKPKPESPKWRNVALWRKLDRQMSKEEVQKLLGPPTKIVSANVLTFWHYGYPLGGQVVFDRGGAIHSWREP